MMMTPATPILPERLKRMRWKGERSYRILSHSFSIRWNLPLTLDRVDNVWGGFAVRRQGASQRNSASRNGGIVYSLVDLGPREQRRYRFLADDQELMITRSPDDLVNHLLWEIFSRMPEQTEGFLLVHSGCVTTPRGEGVLLPADSGSGKTTLVAGLIRSGFGFLSDEIGVIDHHAGVLRPYPRALNFKERSVALFPDLWSSGHASSLARSDGYLRAEAIGGKVVKDPCKVRFVIFPRYQEGAATEIVPLGAVEALQKLWENTLNRPVYGARALPLLADVVRQAKGFHLVSGELGEAVQAVKDLTDHS